MVSTQAQNMAADFHVNNRLVSTNTDKGNDECEEDLNHLGTPLTVSAFCYYYFFHVTRISMYSFRSSLTLALSVIAICMSNAQTGD